MREGLSQTLGECQAILTSQHVAVSRVRNADNLDREGLGGHLYLKVSAWEARRLLTKIGQAGTEEDLSQDFDTELSMLWYSASEMLKNSLENSIYEGCDNEYEFPGSWTEISIFLKNIIPDVWIFLNNIMLLAPRTRSGTLSRVHVGGLRGIGLRLVPGSEINAWYVFSVDGDHLRTEGGGLTPVSCCPASRTRCVGTVGAVQALLGILSSYTSQDRLLCSE